MNRDNHSQIDELLDELARDAAGETPDDAQWESAAGRLRRRLALASEARAPRWSWPRRPAFARLALAAAVLLALICIPALLMLGGAPALATPMTGMGELIVLGPDGAPAGACPLERTDVSADLAGPMARVRVRQAFVNSFDRPIEAVYLFPLPVDAAVDEMTMRIGARVITSEVKEKQEARQLYEQARATGQRAALLEQERPNVFRQSVANIQPGERIEIEIAYSEVVAWVDGRFEFVFPLTVAPRYDPRPAADDAASTATAGGPIVVAAAPTPEPPLLRAGHDISLTVNIAAGMMLREIESPLHEIEVERPAHDRAAVTLKHRDEIPNRDFVLHYTPAEDKIADALFVHEDARGRFFTLMLAPPRRALPADILPRELLFVVDTSGSMRGWKFEQAKAAMRRCIENLNPGDSFNLLSFASDLGRCFEAPAPATAGNIAEGLLYVDRLEAGGGTEMMAAVLAALAGEPDPARERIVVFICDGEVGNDFELIRAVKDHVAMARVFTFGVGAATNRHLMEAMAWVGRGEAQWIDCGCDASTEAADRFYVNLNAPVLTDVRLDWQGVEVEELYPPALPDLFDRKPLLIHGRMSGELRGKLILSGRTAAGAWRREIELPREAAPVANPTLPLLWARARVRHLMLENPVAAKSGSFDDETRAAVTALGLEYRLMTQFTSFVAIERNPFAPHGEPVRVDVPNESPQGEQASEQYHYFGRLARGSVVKGPGEPFAAAYPPAYPDSIDLNRAVDIDNDGDADPVVFGSWFLEQEGVAGHYEISEERYAGKLFFDGDIAVEPGMFGPQIYSNSIYPLRRPWPEAGSTDTLALAALPQLEKLLARRAEGTPTSPTLKLAPELRALAERSGAVDAAAAGQVRGVLVLAWRGEGRALAADLAAAGFVASEAREFERIFAARLGESFDVLRIAILNPARLKELARLERVVHVMPAPAGAEGNVP